MKRLDNLAYGPAGKPSRLPLEKLKSRKMNTHINGQDVDGNGALVPIARLLHRGTMRVPLRTPWQRATLRAIRRVATTVPRLKDRLIEAEYAGRTLTLPLRHDLPLNVRLNPGYGGNLERIARSIASKYGTLAAIDLGANVGDTAILMVRAGTSRVLAIEGEPFYYHLLCKNSAGLTGAIKPIQCVLAGGLMNRVGRLETYSGSARFSLEPAHEPVENAFTLDQLLLHHGAYAHAKLLKSDLDGMDLTVLAGGVGFIGKAKPVIFFEYDPDLIPAAEGTFGRTLLPVLRKEGYAVALFYDNTGVFLAGMDLADDQAIDDVAGYCRGCRSSKYWDIALFHRDDIDVAAAVASEERSLRDTR